jgi:hypothetical protein
VTQRYGDAIRRLCGTTGKTPAQLVAALMDPQHPFDAGTCFVRDTTACRGGIGGPIDAMDPTCYQGQLGASLLDMRTAYFAYQAAYQNLEASRGNAEAAERLCVWKEMDAFGCSALDRHELTGVSCPAGHQGTLELIEQYNDDVKWKQRGGAIASGVLGVVGGILGGAVKGGGVVGGIAGGLSGAAQAVSAGVQVWLAEARRKHELVLQKRAAQADIVVCWNQAEQYERAIASAGEAANQALSQFQAATLAFANARAEADQVVLEAPVVVARERDRAILPIAFHYWVPESIARAQVLLERARRYTYLALRATEYDTQDEYSIPRAGYPLRSAVLGAARPDELLDQLDLLRAQTNNGTPRNGKEPSLGHLTFDLGARFFGLPEGSDQLGKALAAHLRPVYSTTGQYLGLGFRFSLIPSSDEDAPTWRCAERIWRVNVGAVNYPTQNSSSLHLKLIKRNVFASRVCDGSGLRSATFRPESNLLVEGGDVASYQPAVGSSVADLPVVNLDVAGALDDFRKRTEAYDGSSTELSLRGLYGDYILLVPVAALRAGLLPQTLSDVNLRFDFLSVDNLPAVEFRAGKSAGPKVQLDDDASAIHLE